MKLQKEVRIIVILLTLVLLQGCSSTKKLVYFQETASDDDTAVVAKSFIPTIKAGDLLSIQVSSLDPQAAAFFNPVAASTNAPSGGVNTLTPTSGYLVADNGTIKLPIIGRLTVIGLTNDQASELISQKLAPYLKDPTVNLRNQNFRISILGEVNRPALFTIPNERITISEALALAGDLTLYGRRDNILIIREEGGRRSFTRIDITNRNTFRSPYYSLHPNDIIYVEPSKTRGISVDRTYQLAPIILGVLSLLSIILIRY